jgi:hypothetical protein
MTSSQLLLSEYLQCDLYHTVGAYSTAVTRLGVLERKMSKDWDAESDGAALHDAREQDKLRRVTRISRQYNQKLVDRRNFAPRLLSDESAALSHPIPDEFPLTLHQRFSLDEAPDVIEDARHNPWAGPIAWAWVLNFYDAAIMAIELERDPVKQEKYSPETRRLAKTLAQSLSYPRDRPQSNSKRSNEPYRRDRRMHLRQSRFTTRLEEALQCLPGVRRDPPRSADATEFFHRITNDNLSSGYGSVPLFTINALAEAHLIQHAVEAWRSMSLSAHATHAAKHLLASKVDKEPGSTEKAWLRKELNRSIALSTFAYCASRSAPWMFAADDSECREVFEDFSASWEKAVPARCMWISAQMSLLALHRRAYSYGLKGERGQAYNDYYKLLRQIRNVRRRVEAAPIHIEQALGFLGCLESRANQNIGELYRAEHAQRPALKHFQAALDGLKTVEARGEMQEVLTHSRWRVELQISQGKASYEMGNHKDALHWHLKAWRAFLLLLAAETQTEASTEKVDEAIGWLEDIRREPELRKGEVERHLEPIISQLNRLRVHERLGGLASEILLRLGHIILVLRLAPRGTPPTIPRKKLRTGQRRLKAEIEMSLALGCLKKAAECNPHSTLAASNLLKTRLRLAGWIRGQSMTADELRAKPSYNDLLALPPVASVADQWPRGGDDYESISRVTEYLTLLALNPDTACEKLEKSEKGVGQLSRNAAHPDDEQFIARSLLLDFFMHTDSINVRKAQAHRYLMKTSRPATPPRDLATARGGARMKDRNTKAASKRPEKVAESQGQNGAAIEFVSMRRYSSAFPLLPRPSAFRAHGGGYFVRLHPSGKPETPTGQEPAPKGKSGKKPMLARAGGDGPIGIVVDPGPDFVENLFRTGFSLEDVDIIVVTHDHVDHLNSLEMLLSLLNYRDGLVTHEESHEDGGGKHDGALPLPGQSVDPPIIYGNESVVRRYESVSLLNPKKTRRNGKKEKLRRPYRRFRCLSEIGDYVLPAGFSISSMASSDVGGNGHTDLSGNPSYGVCFRHDGGREGSKAALTLAITSDVPAPPDDDAERKRWKRTWGPALTADALVAHVSTVPLTELRKLAQIDARLALSEDDIAEVEKLSRDVKRRLRDLNGMARQADHAAWVVLQKVEENEEDPTVALRATQLTGDLRESLKGLKSMRGELKSATHHVKRIVDGEEGNLKKAVRNLAEVGQRLLEYREQKLDAQIEALVHTPVMRDAVDDLARSVEGLSRMATRPPSDAERLERIRAQLEIDPTLRGRLEYSMWLRSRAGGNTADLVGHIEDDGTEHDWRPPADHPYLRGTIGWARAYRQAREKLAPDRPSGLLVLGELSEELGTARGRLAIRLNQTVFRRERWIKGDPDKPKIPRERSFSALTSDVGLRFFVVHACDGGGCARISCTTCDLDNDRVPDESHHAPDSIVEVCVKGENEGIFYNCRHHDPAAQEDPLFLERLERFDVFGR